MRISRRNAIATTAAALAAAPALASVPAPEGSDRRLIDLERRLARLEAYANRSGPDDVAKRTIDLMNAVEEEMAETPAAGPDGLAVTWRRIEGWAPFGGSMHDLAVESFGRDFARIVGRAAT